jgi:S1-C subfamily serine protease
MKKLLAESSVFALLVSMIAFMFYIPDVSVRLAEREAKNRTVKILVYNGYSEGQGSGTLISHNYILTSAHLFLPAEIKTKIVFKRYEDEDFINAVVVSSDTKRDFALLKFNGKDDVKPLKITPHWHMGEVLILLGNPIKEDFTFGHTKIVGLAIIMNPWHYFRKMIIFPCDTGQPGFSGSGIYNTKGEFMGIFELGQPILHICFAIPSSEILERGLNQPWKIKGGVK